MFNVLRDGICFSNVNIFQIERDKAQLTTFLVGYYDMGVLGLPCHTVLTRF